MTAPIDLRTVWFVLIGIMFTGYAILDGFDLGVGTLLLFTRSEKSRRILLNSIGPVWDGNEVWLVVGGGALFAAFPEVYATVFSGFYLAFMLLLLALIFRAVGIEFRSKVDSAKWKAFWDASFSLASILIAFLAGVALGNMVLGIPLTTRHDYAGSFLALLNPYSVVLGVSTIALFTMHGAIYSVMKTQGELQKLCRQWVRHSMIFFGVMYGILTMATFVFAPHMADKMREQPVLFLLPIGGLLAIANVPREISRGRDVSAFLTSSLAIALLLALFGLGKYPDLVTSSVNPANSMTIYNSSASEATLRTMTVIAIIGLPFVLAYTVVAHRVFRGKVREDLLHY